MEEREVMKYNKLVNLNLVPLLFRPQILNIPYLYNIISIVIIELSRQKKGKFN